MNSTKINMGGGGNELQRLTSTENLFLGLAAGMGCKAINYPLLHWKNRAQQKLPISLNPAVVYRGLPMAMMNLGGTTALQFGLTGFFQKAFAGRSADGTLSKEMEMMSSFLAGLFSGIPCSMYELTMIQQQKFGGSVAGTLLRINRDSGATTMFRGTIMTMGRESLYTMGMLGGTPIIQRMLMENYGIEKSTALAGGSLIGAVCAVVLTHPMDTIKVYIILYSFILIYVDVSVFFCRPVCKATLSGQYIRILLARRMRLLLRMGSRVGCSEALDGALHSYRLLSFSSTN